MSKFYTHETLKEHFLHVENVTFTRNELIKFVLNKALWEHIAVYGSSAWSLNPEFGIVHNRRSDVDIAVIADEFGRFKGDDEFDDICSDLESRTGVYIEKSIISNSKMIKKSRSYSEPDEEAGLVNPNIIDHFRLLATHFRSKTYSELMENLRVEIPQGGAKKRWFDERAERLPYLDLLNAIEASGESRGENIEHYLVKIYRGVLEPLQNLVQEKKPYTLISDDNLLLLCVLENFPPYLLRKVQGCHGTLPCPDSKSEVMKTFYDSLNSNAKETLSSLFKEMAQCSDRYEKLIDQVGNGLEKIQYDKELFQIATRMVSLTEKMFDYIPLSNPKDIMAFFQQTKTAY